MRVHIDILVEILQAVGLVQEMRTPLSDPYWFVWRQDPLSTITVVHDYENMVQLEFVLIDLVSLDEELANEVMEQAQAKLGCS